MARMRCLKFMAGTSLALTMGCQTPAGPTNSVGMPPPVFPGSPLPGPASARTSAPNLPPPAIGDSKLRIGSPAAQTGQAANQGVAKLRPLDPSMATAPQANPAFPPTIAEKDNVLRNLASSNDWQLDQKTMSMPVSGNRMESSSQFVPPPPMTALPSMLPQENTTPHSPQTSALPPVSFPAIPTSQPPAFPPPPPNPANYFPTVNYPAGPHLSPSGASRQTVYQGANQ